MNKNNLKLSKTGIALLMSFSCSALFAGGIADVSYNGDSLSLSPTVSFDAAGLRVSGDNTAVTQVFQNGDDISMSLSSMGDGVYRYELGLSSESEIDPAGDESASIPPDVTQSGQFRIVNGVASVYDTAVIEAEAQAEADLIQTEQQQAVAQASSLIDGLNNGE